MLKSRSSLFLAKSVATPSSMGSLSRSLHHGCRAPARLSAAACVLETTCAKASVCRVNTGVGFHWTLSLSHCHGLKPQVLSVCITLVVSSVWNTLAPTYHKQPHPPGSWPLIPGNPGETPSHVVLQHLGRALISLISSPLISSLRFIDKYLRTELGPLVSCRIRTNHGRSPCCQDCSHKSGVAVELLTHAWCN